MKKKAELISPFFILETLDPENAPTKLQHQEKAGGQTLMIVLREWIKAAASCKTLTYKM